jgi:hypothetical protein
MGAEFNYRLFDDKLGKEKIAKLWAGMCEQSRSDRGRSYSGCIGMLKGSPVWEDTMYPTEDKAHKFVAESQHKWEPPVASSYTDEAGQKNWLIGGWCSS